MYMNEEDRIKLAASLYNHLVDLLKEEVDYKSLDNISILIPYQLYDMLPVTVTGQGPQTLWMWYGKTKIKLLRDMEVECPTVKRKEEKVDPYHIGGCI